MDSSMDRAGRSSPWTPASLALSRLSLTRFAKLENIRCPMACAGQPGCHNGPTATLQPFSRRPSTCHICTRTGLTLATSAPGRGPLLPHLHRDWAHSRHICTGTEPTLATSAPGRGPLLPHLHRDGAHSRHLCEASAQRSRCCEPAPCVDLCSRGSVDSCACARSNFSQSTAWTERSTSRQSRL